MTSSQEPMDEVEVAYQRLMAEARADVLSVAHISVPLPAETAVRAP